MVAGTLGAVILLAGCAPSKEETPIKLGVTPIVDDLGRFTAEAVGTPVTENPWISHVTIADLDQDGLPDILATDDRLNAIVWLRQVRPGHFEESVLCGDLPGVVHVEAVDFNHTGHQDLLVACMGEVFPNNDKIGSVIILENDGHQHFTRHVLLDHVARVTDVQAANLAGHQDGKLDLAVGQFGYNQGEIRWMKNLGDWKFESHILLSLSGTINVCCADLCGHGYTDIVAVVSQEWEEVVLFKNDGSGNFTNIVLFGSTNEDYGSSGISLCDLNGDGLALQTAFFEALGCMGLPTTLVGYSPKQDRVIQYQAELTVTTFRPKEGRITFWQAERLGPPKVETLSWVDYLFDQKPVGPGHWKYEIDYSGRLGCLDDYEIRYDSHQEKFVGTRSSLCDPATMNPPGGPTNR